MKKFLAIAFILVLALGVFTACGTDNQPAETENSSVEMISVKHRLGTTDVPKNPEKLVVMDFGMLDTIQILELTPELAVPANNLPAYLSAYDNENVLNIGGLKEYDMEKIHGFAPDLIILGGRQEDAYDEFAEIAPTILLSADNSNYYESSIENITELGRIFNRESEVASALKDIETKIEALTTFASEEKAQTLILLTNEGSLSVYGSGSRFGIIHDTFGFPTADDAIEDSTHGQEVNYEYLSKTNPDYMFVVDRTAAIGGDIKGDETLDNELVNATTAAEENQILMLNPDVWYLSGGGLESLTLMVDEITQFVL